MARRKKYLAGQFEQMRLPPVAEVERMPVEINTCADLS